MFLFRKAPYFFSFCSNSLKITLGITFICGLLTPVFGCAQQEESSPQATHLASRSPESRATSKENAALKFKEATGLPLPTNVELQFVENDGGIDSLNRIVFSVNGASFSDWEKSLSIQDAQYEDTKRYQLGPDDGQWQPSQEEQLPTAQIQFSNGKTLIIGKAERNNPEKQGKLKIYLVYFGS